MSKLNSNKRERVSRLKRQETRSDRRAGKSKLKQVIQGGYFDPRAEDQELQPTAKPLISVNYDCDEDE